MINSSPLNINIPDEDIFNIYEEEEFVDKYEDFDMTMYFYGSKYEQGCGVRVFLFIPQGFLNPYSLRY